jgi:hypothetical protein
MRSKRLGRALLLAPLAAPLVVVFCVLPYGLVSLPVGESLPITLLFGVVATVISYILTIFLGLPMHWFLQRRRLVRGRHYGLAGFFLGAMSFLVPLGIRRTQMRIAAGASFFDLPYDTGRWYSSMTLAPFPWWLIVLGAGSGLATAITGWCLLRRSKCSSAL